MNDLSGCFLNDLFPIYIYICDAMPKINFLKARIVKEVPAGTKLDVVADEVNAGIKFDCRAAMCNSCIVTVVSGWENLSPMQENEKQCLEMFGADTAKQRLACQVIVNGDVELDY